MADTTVPSALQVEQWDSNFAVEYLHPYSCTLNPIERLWNVVKG